MSFNRLAGHISRRSRYLPRGPHRSTHIHAVCSPSKDEIFRPQFFRLWMMSRFSRDSIHRGTILLGEGEGACRAWGHRRSWKATRFAELSRRPLRDSEEVVDLLDMSPLPDTAITQSTGLDVHSRCLG